MPAGGETTGHRAWRLDAPHESATGPCRRRTQSQSHASRPPHPHIAPIPPKRLPALTQIPRTAKAQPLRSAKTPTHKAGTPHKRKVVQLLGRLDNPTPPATSALPWADSPPTPSRPAAGGALAMGVSRPCCASRSGCAPRHRPRPGGRRWWPGKTDRPGSPTGRGDRPC